MSKLTEKLGIKPLARRGDCMGRVLCYDEPVEELEQQRNELLETLIAACQELELYYEMIPGYTSDECEYIDTIKEITKISWEKVKEIKQLIGG